MDCPEFAEYLRDQLVEYNLTDLEASHLLDVSRPTIERWKRERTCPSPVIRSYVIGVFDSYEALSDQEDREDSDYQEEE
jgi:hypothetical protein